MYIYDADQKYAKTCIERQTVSGNILVCLDLFTVKTYEDFAITKYYGF